MRPVNPATEGNEGMKLNNNDLTSNDYELQCSQTKRIILLRKKINDCYPVLVCEWHFRPKRREALEMYETTSHTLEEVFFEVSPNLQQKNSK